MSKITNDGLTPSGTGRFIAVLYPYGNSGRRRVNAAHRCRSQGGQGHMSPPLFGKKFLHDFAADTRHYMRELLVWLCVIQSVFEVKVLYLGNLNTH